jgi:hypothetical protein
MIFYSPIVCCEVKWRRMSWVGLVAHVGEKRNAQKILLWKLSVRDNDDIEMNLMK